MEMILEFKPKRSIVFILFTAEEKGLLGSRYHVENPLYPLDKTAAFVNLDMMGRNDIDGKPPTQSDNLSLSNHLLFCF